MFKKFSSLARVPTKATTGSACCDVYSARVGGEGGGGEGGQFYKGLLYTSCCGLVLPILLSLIQAVSFTRSSFVEFTLDLACL